MGIDDFAIRKGHTYNTGIHDLRNGTFLDVIPSRTLKELAAYFRTHPTLCTLNPYAIVMNLAQTYQLAKRGFVCWLNDGEHIDHLAIKSCLSTIENWQKEISNYHQLRFTNAAVERKNKLIKALQQRHFFTRNPQHYKETILIECNAEWIQYGF